MKIEVWSDFVCPFCYIGKRRLEMALDQFGHKNEVDVDYKAFQLDPTAPAHTDQSIYQALAQKFGTTEDQVKQMNQGLIEQASEIGLTYNYDTMKPTNTFDAHRLAKYAKTLGKEKELTEVLMKAYFTDSLNVGDHETLAHLAEQVGIERTDALDVLVDESAYADAVRSEQGTAHEIGVTGVPFFLINQKYAISGAQPLETFIGALEKIWEEDHPKPQFINLSQNADAMCTDDSCVIPDKNEE